MSGRSAGGAPPFLSRRKTDAALDEDIAILRRMLDYDPLTGAFRWSESAGRRGPAKHGMVAGCVRPACGGYVWIGICYTQQRAHVLAWLLTHGAHPAGQIDHINGDPSDNRIANLRVVSNRVNSQNKRRPYAHNTTGYLGVSRDKRRGVFVARIRIPSGKYLWLGSHRSAKAAYAAFLAAKRRLHEGNTL